MRRVILLATGWQPDYWDSDKEAPYYRTIYSEIANWDDLSNACPLPGIGIYIMQKRGDFSSNSFVYLKIKGMRYDPNTKHPLFSLEFLAKSNIKSSDLSSKLSPENRRFFSAIEPKEIIQILNELGAELPEKWKKLLDITEEIVSWQDYIGKNFLEIETMSLSNDEFEDRTATLLNALGFNVGQKGHTLPGEYPDGIFYFGDYAVVYDCKNSSNFVPSADNIRAIEKYLNDEKRVRGENNIYPAFIAKSFGPQYKEGVFYLTVNALIYLLYKKLLLGSEFTLNPIMKMLYNKTPLTKEIIDKEWRGGLAQTPLL